MSAETTGIPLVVRYNSRGQPDGLKEELNIIVNSVSANEYKGGNISATGIPHVSSIEDVSITGTIQTGHVIAWDTTGWVNVPQTGGPGSTTFTGLTDTPGVYPDPADDPPDPILRYSPDGVGGGPGIIYSQHGEADLTNLFTKIYDPIDSIPADSDKLLRVQVTPGGTFTLGNQENSVFAFDDVTNAPGAGAEGRLVTIGGAGGNTYVYSDVKDTELVTTTTTRELTNGYFTLANKSLANVNAVSGHVLYYNGTNWVNQPVTTGSGPINFTDISDVYEADYTGHANNIVVVNSTPDGIVFSNYTTTTLSNAEQVYTNIRDESTAGQALFRSGTSSVSGRDFLFTELNDTPTGYGATNQLLKSNGTGLAFSTSTDDDVSQAKSLYTAVTGLTTNEILIRSGATVGSIPQSNFIAAGASITALGGVDSSVVAGGDKIIVSHGTNLSASEYDLTNLYNSKQIYQEVTAVTTNGYLLTRDTGGLIGSTDPSNFVATSTYTSHTGDTNIHFTVGSINHNSIAGRDATDAHSQYVLTSVNSSLSGYATDLSAYVSSNETSWLEKTTALASLTTDVILTEPIELNHIIAYEKGEGVWRNYAIDGVRENPNRNESDPNTSGLPELIIHVSGLGTSGFTQRDLLAVGPSGTLVPVSSLLPSINPVPLFEDIGKLIIINESATDLIESSAMKWDYTSQGLQVLGDVSAQNYYGNITGATGEISNISGVSSIQFDINMPPEYTAVEGEVYYDSDAHTLSIQTSTDTTLQVGQEQVIRVRNGTNTTINNGEVVYLSGVQGTGAAKLLVGKASASTSEEIQDIIGIATQTIVSGHDGFITTFGIVNDVDTAAYPVGTILYLSTSAGLYTSAAPPAPNHSVRLGIVLRQSSTDGSIFAHIDPGYDIADLHDVSVQGVQTGDLLRWNGTIFAPSAYDHGTLAGLADNDHPQYVLSSTNQVLSSLVGNIETSTINLSGYIAANEPSWLSVATEHNTLLGLDNNEAHPQYVLSATNQALSSLVTSIESSAIDLSAYIAANEATWSTDTDTTDHGSLTGRSDDDHTQYIIKTNTTQARNTIQPNADVPALTLQAGLSNTGRLFDIKDSTTQTVAYITIDGTIVTDGGLTVGGTKSFLIDHPTKEAMKLQYSCLEGPENGVYVRGRVTSEVIDLPDYWVGLVHENSITVTLSPVGSAQSDLYVSNIADNKVHLARESNQPIDCFYIVNATRKDLENLLVEFPK